MERSLEQMLQQMEARAGALPIAPSVQDIGRVLSVGDGVARVSGLPEVANNEVVVFANGTRGQVLDLAHDVVGCVLYGGEAGIAAGSPVLRTGQLARVPVGEEVLGRVIDPLGVPRDGGEPLATTEWRDVEEEAPGVLDRQPVREPLLTGLKVIDAAVPIGLDNASSSSATARPARPASPSTRSSIRRTAASSASTSASAPGARPSGR